jgi:hypothetical protein
MSEETRQVRAADIVEEALSWVKTPFEHQGRLKGVGVDCVNFVAEVAAATEATPDVEFERNYRRHEDGTQMLRELFRYLEHVGNGPEAAALIRRGDMIAFHNGFDRELPVHVGFATRLEGEVRDGRAERYTKMAHASRAGVRHHRLDAHFKSLIHSVWRRPGLIYD